MVSFPTESSSQSGGYYYQNLVSIAEFLMSNGWSRAAAAGAAGTIAGESTGNPESVGSGGGGLIGWTPIGSAAPDSNIITGNASSDFDTQLTDMLAYFQANSSEAVARGGVDLATLQKSTDPTTAASNVSAFFGPKSPGSDVRTGVVTQVYNSLAGYTANSAYTQVAGATSDQGSSGGLLSFPTEITSFFSQADTFVTTLMWITKPGNWVRIIAALAGVVLLLFAIYALVSVAEGSDKITPSMPTVMPIPV